LIAAFLRDDDEKRESCEVHKGRSQTEKQRIFRENRTLGFVALWILKKRRIGLQQHLTYRVAQTKQATTDNHH